ncbi:EAL domain-containing protein [Methylomonas methanica]|uniref:EAL domain-containing protein n=1 Tax=Methylomonas methanica TaxID=421 RepID=UPI0009EE66D1|nr:EAL domain-containing protein [Methylomonas methanica]
MSHQQVNLTKLREMAEKVIEHGSSGLSSVPERFEEIDIGHLVEELRVYQTELEIQNQELNSAQSKISTALEQYRALFENLPLPGIILDSRGFIVEANRQACTFIGLRQNTALQHRSALQLFDQDSRSQIYQVLHDRTNLAPQILNLLGVKVGVAQTIPCDVHVIHLHEESEEDMRTLLVLVDQSTEVSLRESEYHLETIIKNEPECINILDAQGLLIQMNPAGLAMIEADALAQVAGRLFLDFVAPEYRSAYANLHRQVLAGQPVQMRYEIVGLKGRRRWMETHAVPMQAHGELALLAVTRDISERKLAEEKIQLAASVFSTSREGILITSADGAIIDVNDAFTQITGYSRDDAMGQNPRMLSSGKQDKVVYEALWHSLITTGYWFGELWNRHKNGEMYAENLSISAVRDADGITRHYVGLFSDITSTKMHAQQMERIAHYDALTGLPNRVLLSDRLQLAMAQTQRRGQQLAVAFLDLDGFKAVNDKQGHEAGDQLLVALANHMKRALRDGDTLARLGGDEFVAVLVDLADVNACQPLLSRLLAAAAQQIHYGDHQLQVSASLGVTFYPQSEDIDADQLLRQADQAMYQAKLAGKNRYHIFDAHQDSSIRGHHENVEDIRRAICAEEFVLYYQPKVNMRTGEVIGAEALIRWQHPEKGLLLPAAFLPVIEDHPLAVTLGTWVIDTALTQLETWHAAGLNIAISVNVCARQLQQTDFVQYLSDILAAHPNVQPADLELEVLETSALEDLEHVSNVIKGCQDIGVKFALDDFGTGYSSLTYLKRLPVSSLKIDQSFVHDMLVDPDDLAIVEGVLSLATAFYRHAIAEGVETIEHGRLLLQFGCELAQGYGIARPMPAHKIVDWTATWTPDPSWVDLVLVNRDDLSVLYAGVQHRAWVTAMEKCLKGGQETPAPLNHLRSRLGLWLEGKGHAQYNGQPAFQAIKQWCDHVHLQTKELCQLQASARISEALTRLAALQELTDTLLEQVNLLVQENRTKV